MDFTFYPPARSNDIAEIESSLGITLPDELLSLLQESDGVEGSHDLGLIWNTKRIKQDNLFFREFSDHKDRYMSFDNLLSFADAGNGDQFAFRILDTKIQRSDIFIWDHEDDHRQWVAPSLDIYLEWWLGGKLKV